MDIWLFLEGVAVVVDIGMVEVHFGGCGKKGEVRILRIVGFVQR